MAPLAQTGFPDEIPTDLRVERALDALEYIYEAEDNGDYALAFDTDEGRSQGVWISPLTDPIGAMEMREVYSVAYEYPGAVPADVALDLLEQNVGFVIGAWAVEENRILFIARVDANASAEVLDAAMAAVMYTADELEATLSGGEDVW